MKYLKVILVITLLLIGCADNTEEVPNPQQEKIALLTKQIDSVNRSIDNVKAESVQIREELDKNLESLSAKQKPTGENEYLWPEFYLDSLNIVTSALLFGSELELHEAMKQELKMSDFSINYRYSILERLAYIQFKQKNRSSVVTSRPEYETNAGNEFVDGAASNNNPHEPYKYLFEYLGDCGSTTFSLSFNTKNGRANSSSWFVYLIREKLTVTQQHELIDFCCKRAFAVLNEWFCDDAINEAGFLVNAYRYVLSSSAAVDYQAKLVDYKFVNKTYESEWNGIQKFFYRLEKRLPGAVERVQFNIKNEITRISQPTTDSLSVEDDA